MQTSRSKRLVKMLEGLLKQDHLYSDEELRYMKNQLKIVKEELSATNAKNYKGFGK
tara:strand:- start:30 stop:197 length:168 start_codon:yes stop_codon:yes gene_type:complete